MKKYPYIGEFNDYSMVLFLGKGEGFVLKHPITPLYKLDSNWCEGQFKNITREYLQNTWGVVESKEHAEFIIELAKNAGLDVYQYVGHYKRYRNGTMIMGWSALPYNDFIFEDDTLLIGAGKYPDEIEDNPRLNKKQITIPLPPKADKQELSEWSPKIGDDVVIADQHNKLEGKLLALTKEYAIISQPHGEQHLHLGSWIFEKPKSAQDLLIEELHQKLLANNCSDEYLLACDIVQGKIEGLSYNP